MQLLKSNKEVPLKCEISYWLQHSLLEASSPL